MKITELIKRLEEAKKWGGNVDVEFYDDESSKSVMPHNVCEIVKTEEGYVESLEEAKSHHHKPTQLLSILIG